MSEHRSLIKEAHKRAPLLFYWSFLLILLLFGHPGFAKHDSINPPCQVDSLVTLGWCPGDTLHIAGYIYSAPGIYALAFQSLLGCDSIVNLRIQPLLDTPQIGQDPIGLYLGAADTGVFSSASVTGVDCRWQLRQGTGIWQNIQADTVHLTPFSPNLQVVAQGGDSSRYYRYHCRGCLSAASSQPAELRVYPQQLPITLHLPSITSCVGVNTTIAVRFSDWQNVGRIALNLLLPSSSMQLVQWNVCVPGLTLSVHGDTVKILKATTVVSIPFSGDTLLILVVRPLVTGILPLNWLVPQAGTFGLQFINSNTSWVHRLVQVNGQIIVPSQAAQIVQEPVSASVRTGDTVSFVAIGLHAIGYRWQIRTGNTWRSLVETGVYNGTQTPILNVNGAPDSLNNARLRLIAFGACGRNDTSWSVDLLVESRAPVIRLSFPPIQACTTGQYALSLNVDSFNHVAAFSLRIAYNPDSLQYMSTIFIHPSLGTGVQILPQNGGITMNWYGVQQLQLGSTELFRFRFQVSGSSFLEWDTTAQGTGAWSPYQQRLRIRTEAGSVAFGPLPAQVSPVPCLFVGDDPVALSAWPPGGTFSGVGVQGHLLNVGSSAGVRSLHYQATFQGCSYARQITYEVFPAPTQTWLNSLDVCSGTPLTLTARRSSGILWSTGDSSETISIYPASDTIIWVRYTSPTGCFRVDSIRIQVQTVPNAAVEDTIYYYNNNTGPLQLRASGGVSYRWLPAAGLSDSTSATPFATPDSTTTYTVFIADSLGCSRSFRVLVARPEINPAPNQVICRGDSIRLTAPVLFTHQPFGGFSPSFSFPLPTYLWQPTTGLDDPTSPNPRASPGQTTAYWVRVVVAQNCTLTAQRGVIVLDPPQLEIGYDSIQTSIGHPVRLLPHIWDTLSPVLYQWAPGTGLSDSTHPQPLANPLSTTTYILSVQTSAGCRSIDSVVVVVSQFNQGAVLQGQLIYDNPGQTPIREGRVILMPLSAPIPVSNNDNGALFKSIRKREKKVLKIR